MMIFASVQELQTFAFLHAIVGTQNPVLEMLTSAAAQ